MTALFTPRAKVDEDSYRDRIPTALEEIHARGNLLRFAPERPDRLALMQVLSVQGLIGWNKTLAKYELTEAGNECLAQYHDRLAKGQRKAAG